MGIKIWLQNIKDKRYMRQIENKKWNGRCKSNYVNNNTKY